MKQQPPSKQQLRSLIGKDINEVVWLAGDASDRCYYRIFLRDNTTVVMMLLSSEDQKSLVNGSYDWVLVQKTLDIAQVPTPSLLHTSSELSCLIIEDYGDEMLETRLHSLLHGQKNKDVESCYLLATEMVADLLNILPADGQVWCQRSFDQERFAWELEFFKKYYIEQHLKITLTAQQLKDFAKDVDKLSAFLGEQSKYFVHRDFHSRNLMVRDQSLAVIDFQDARIGAAAYDLVSLVYDSYIPFTTKARNALFERCLAHLETQLNQSVFQEIRNTYSAVLLQRQLKVLGSFAYLNYAKQKPNYLQYIPVAVDILHSIDFKHADWPFLSGEFLNMLSHK